VLTFDADAQQPVPDPPAPVAKESILDFFEQQCASVNRFFGLVFGGGGCCGREPKKEVTKGEEPPPIVEEVAEKSFPLHSALKKVPLLSGLSDADLHKLESVCEMHTYTPGQLIFESGDMGDFAVVVLSGELVIHLIPTEGQGSSFGGEQLTSQRLLRQGEHLGAQTLLVSRPRGFSLVSAQTSCVALLHRGSLMGAIGPLDNHIMKDRDLYSKFAPLLHHRHI